MGLEGKLEDGTTIDLEGKYLVYGYGEQDQETEGWGVQVTEVTPTGGKPLFVTAATYDPCDLDVSVRRAIEILRKRGVTELYSPVTGNADPYKLISGWHSTSETRDAHGDIEEWAEYTSVFSLDCRDALNELEEAGFTIRSLY